MDSEQFVLEWSEKQNAFHIQGLSHSLASNQQRFMDDKPSDYVVLMVGTKEVCHQMADNWRDRLEARSMAEAA